MRNTLQQLAHKIHRGDQKGNFLEPYSIEISTIEVKDFVVYNVQTFSDIYLLNLFLAGKRVLEELSWPDWINILESVKQEEHQLGFLASFLFKYVGIDVRIYFEQEDILTDHFRAYFESKPTLFSYSRIDDIPLKKFRLIKEDFTPYRQELLKQGATAAETVTNSFPSIKDVNYDPEKGGYFF
jgi:hypothetical protein